VALPPAGLRQSSSSVVGVTMTESVTLTTADGDMPAYVAQPEATPLGGVVVIQEAFGVTTHIEDVARRFADAGYLAIAPALFHRNGSPVLGYDDLDGARPQMAALTRLGIVADLDAAFGWLREAGVTVARQAIVGFCMGGSVATFAAGSYAVGAAISFYGGGVAEGRFGFPPLVELAPAFTTPWLGLYGGEDHGIPVSDVDAMRAAAAAATVTTDVVLYPGAQHGFHCDDRPAVYDAEAAQAGWARTLEFLAAELA
jgi:carboxymethylenebutenolidase